MHGLAGSALRAAGSLPGYSQGRDVSGCWKLCQENKAAPITLAPGLPAEDRPWQHGLPFLENSRAAGFSYREVLVLCVDPGLGCFSSQIRSALGHRQFRSPKDDAGCCIETQSKRWILTRCFSIPSRLLLSSTTRRRAIQRHWPASGQGALSRTPEHHPCCRCDGPAGDERPSGALPLLLSLWSPRGSLHSTTG